MQRSLSVSFVEKRSDAIGIAVLKIRSSIECINHCPEGKQLKKSCNTLMTTFGHGCLKMKKRWFMASWHEFLVSRVDHARKHEIWKDLILISKTHFIAVIFSFNSNIPTSSFKSKPSLSTSPLLMASFSSCGFPLHWFTATVFVLVWKFRRFVVSSTSGASVKTSLSLPSTLMQEVMADSSKNNFGGFSFHVFSNRKSIEWTLTQCSQFDTLSCSLSKHWCLWFRKNIPWTYDFNFDISKDILEPQGVNVSHCWLLILQCLKP